MKGTISHKHHGFLSLLWIAAFVLLAAVTATAQDAEEPKKDTRPVRNMFESNWLIDHQTVIVPIQGTLEMDILHRFGTVANGYDDLWGLYAPSNIRIGFTHVFVNNLQVGFGFTKERKYWDFNAKYALFQQGRSGGAPFSVTYYVNAGVDTRPKKDFVSRRLSGEFLYEATDRWSYFHQLMIARKVTDALSLQASLSMSHFNYMDEIPLEELPGAVATMNHDHFAAALMGRLKISDAMGIIFHYDLPLTDHDINNPEPNLSIGLQMVSSSHAFQIFLGNYYSIIPQRNSVFNGNNPNLISDYMIGFNITRLWNF